QQLELPGGQLVPRVDLAQLAHRMVAEQGEEQSGARAPFLEQPGRRRLRTLVCGPDGHRRNISSNTDDRAAYMISDFTSCMRLRREPGRERCNKTRYRRSYEDRPLAA